jgi:hypothetical protein
MMHTIRLRVNSKTYKNLMLFLKRFKKEEIQIIHENDEFLSIKEYLDKELEMIESGNAKLLSVDQLENQLETTIRRHET